VSYLFFLFVGCVCFQIIYQLALTTAILIYKQNKNINTSPKSVSIIICAKNEAKNLEANLPFILQQNYVDFEIIIVDDGSDIPIYLEHPKIKIIRIETAEKIGIGKKYALQKGIEMAKNEWILLTDADCKPHSQNWITEMTLSIKENHKIVLGVSPYQINQTFLNQFIGYETALTALQYIGFALLKNPYMSVGRNVLYASNLIKQKKWNNFELSVASGDDDLMLQSLATPENTTVCLTLESYTYSEAKKNWMEYCKQKMRHYESGNLYKRNHRFFLGGFILSKFLMYLSLILLGFLFYNQYTILFIPYYKLFVCLMIFYIVYIFCISTSNFILQKKMRLNKDWYFSFVHDIIYCFFTVIFGCISLLKPTKNWK